MSFCSRISLGSLMLLIAGLSVFFVMPAMSGCGDSGEPSSELNIDENKTPYLVKLTTCIGPHAIDSPRNETMIMCDIDGDGIRERVEGTYQKFLGTDSEDAKTKPRWEVHLDDECVLHDKESRLGICADFNDDGIEEIYFTTRSKDHRQWYFCVLDPAIPGIVLNVPLPLGEDRRRPDHWDGYYMAEGILQDADGQGNPGVVLVRRVAYDATKRGICVVNPLNGQVIWEYVGGAQPHAKPIVVTDMDGDGKREVIFSTSGPGNWGDTKINGTGDKEIYLIALSNLGEVLMQEVIGGERFQGQVVAHDLNGDGVKELVTATSNANNGRTNELAVWDWPTGRILKRVRSSDNFLGLVAMDGPQPGLSYIFTGSDDGTIQRYIYTGKTLKCDRQVLHASPMINLSGATDILPPPGPELIAELENGTTTVILDRDLKTLAVYSDVHQLSKSSPMAWELSDGQKALVLSNPRIYWILEFDKRPWDVAGLILRWGLPVLGILLLLAAFYFGRMTGRRHRHEAGSTSREIAGTADFDSLFRLQQELEDAFHSVIGQAKGLERLVWLLEAYSTDLGENEKLELRIRQVLDDFQVEVGPRLFRILLLAEQTSFETLIVADTGKALDSLTGCIGKLGDQPLTCAAVKAVRNELRTGWKTVRDGFFLLRTAINTYFTTDPVRLIQGMLLVREGDFQRERIQSTLLGGVESSGSMNCRIDNGDLRFVMDNLLENAIRAMKDSTTRQLTVQLLRAGKEVTLRVQDTGKGIVPAQQEAIFSSRFSSRSGGGRGLHRSREILARWGAEILLVESRSGKGTTFIVKLLAASDNTGQKTKESHG